MLSGRRQFKYAGKKFSFDEIRIAYMLYATPNYLIAKKLGYKLETLYSKANKIKQKLKNIDAFMSFKEKSLALVDSFAECYINSYKKLKKEKVLLTRNTLKAGLDWILDELLVDTVSSYLKDCEIKGSIMQDILFLGSIDASEESIKSMKLNQASELLNIHRNSLTPIYKRIYYFLNNIQLVKKVDLLYICRQLSLKSVSFINQVAQDD